MRWPGSIRSRAKSLARRKRGMKVAVGALALLISGPALCEAVRPYDVVGDAIPASLTGRSGDAVRGRAIVVTRQYTCLLCHSGPFAEQKFQGNLAPDLTGTGARWSEGQLRLRLVDASRLNAATIMPSYHRTEGLERVGENWHDRPILSAEQIEDVVTYLGTLREP